MCDKYRYPKVTIFIVCLLANIMLWGCSKDKGVLEDFKFNEVNTYVISEFLDETSGLRTPQSIVCIGEAVYIADEEADCVHKFDKYGNLISTLGTTGNGIGELLSPIALATDMDENIYVAEKGNYRIQIFDKNDNYVNHINLDKLKDNKTDELFDLEVSEDHTIYLTVKTYKKDMCRLYVIKNNKVHSLEKEISGTIGSDSKKENLTYIQSYMWEDGNLLSATGYIGRIEKDKISYLNSLPTKYSASDVVIYDNYVYAYSSGYTTLDKFSLEGNYIETIFSQEASSENRGMSYLAVDNQGRFYINDSINSKVYKIEKK